MTSEGNGLADVMLGLYVVLLPTGLVVCLFYLLCWLGRLLSFIGGDRMNADH